MVAHLAAQDIPIAVPSKFDTATSQTLAVLAVAAVGITILLALLPDAGHDQQWLLLAAQRMGPHLNPYGPTVFESNPPLAIWLSALVVTLANLLHLSLTVTFKLAVCVVAATSALVSAKLLPPLDRTRLSLLAIAFVLIFGAIPARDFGQRDHILTLLILPYLTAASRNRLSIPARIAITVTAALGIALKPHQLLIPIAVELTLLLINSVPHSSRPHRDEWVHGRPRLLEPTLFLATALTYLAAIHHFAPTYLTQILPILRQTYWAFGSLTLPQLLLASLQLHILALVSITLYLRRPGKQPLIFLAAAVAATLAYYWQGTGWYYQQLPAISLLACALLLQLLDLFRLKPLNPPRWLPIPTAALTLLTLALTIHFSHFHRTPRGIEQSQPIPDPTFFANLTPGTAVATITTSVDDTVPPAFRYHLVLAQRYPHLWMLPAILRNQSGDSHRIPPASLAALDHLQHQFMVEDLQRWHPTLILVARCQDPAVHCQVLEDRHDNLLAWFQRDPAFTAIFSHYQLLRSSGPYDAYILTAP